MQIGQLFHLTPLVDDLSAAEAFFLNVFSPIVTYRDYAPHWHRDAAMLSIADTVIEPMQPHPPAPGQQGTSWYRYMAKFGPRVHNLAFYVQGVDELAKQFTDKGISITDGGVTGNLFTYPKSTAPMLEFYERQDETLMADPRLSPAWRPFRDDFWPRFGIGLVRLSHITVVVHDRAATAEFYRTVLDAVALPVQASSVAGAEAVFMLVGEDTIVELAEPIEPDCAIRTDLDEVGQCVTGAVFTVRDLDAVTHRFGYAQRLPSWTRSAHRIDFDPKATWNCAYTLTDAVLVGDPRVS